jgi:ABC transport system ATP-binding/permease protein
MSNLITLEDISLDFGVGALLSHAKLHVMAGERICLIGRNGAGKSSLLKIIEGTLLPDSGSVWRKPGARIARLQQELPQSSPKTVYEFVAEGLSVVGELLTAYNTIIQNLSEAQSDHHLKELERLQQKLRP